MKVLDKTRHFCQIYGETENGAVYHQDGVDFRGDGTAIGEPDQEVVAEVEAVSEVKAETKAQEKARLKVGAKAAADKEPAEVSDLA